MSQQSLRVLALNCTLKKSGAKESSSTDRLLDECLRAFRSEGADCELVRVADLHIPPGVSSDEGDGDEWPELRSKVLDCHILLLGTPIWVGQPTSILKRVMERMDGFYEETDELGRMPSYGKVATLAVVGNEDGAHHVAASVFQGMSDLGFTLPGSGMTYWVGEAMSGQEYKDRKSTPSAVDKATRTMVKMAVHLANLLKSSPYPAVE